MLRQISNLLEIMSIFYLHSSFIWEKGKSKYWNSSGIFGVSGDILCDGYIWF